MIGHSFGGLLTQILAGRGCSAVSVALDPAPFRGVLPLPISSLKSAFPVLHNPLDHGRAAPLTYEQFRNVFANEVDENEAMELFNTYAVPGSGVHRPRLGGRRGDELQVRQATPETLRALARQPASESPGKLRTGCTS